MRHAKYSESLLRSSKVLKYEANKNVLKFLMAEVFLLCNLLPFSILSHDSAFQSYSLSRTSTQKQFPHFSYFLN